MSTTNYVRSALFCAVAAFPCMGCYPVGVGAPDQGKADGFPAADLLGSGCQGNETFAAAQTAMLTGCSGGPRMCHENSPFAAGLDLTTAHAYADLVGVPATGAPTKLRVRPGDPNGSFLVQKLTDTLLPSEGLPMPQGEGIVWRPPNSASLAILKCWIALGARNND